MAAKPVVNGGIDGSNLTLPDWKKYANDVTDDKRGRLQPILKDNMDMNVLSKYFSDIVKLNPKRFRLFGPDETMSNRFFEMFKVTNRQWMGKLNIQMMKK